MQEAGDAVEVQRDFWGSADIRSVEPPVTIDTNQLLIDRLVWPDIRHLRPTGLERLGKAEPFGTEYRVSSCRAVAHALVEAALSD